MAAKGKVPSCGCSIVCSKVCSNLRWFLNLKMARKGFPMGIPRSGKFFFVSFGKAFFFGESKQAVSRASELCFVTNALNAKRPGRNAGL